jgi:hypothetical protein
MSSKSGTKNHKALYDAEARKVSERNRTIVDLKKVIDGKEAEFDLRMEAERAAVEQAKIDVQVEHDKQCATMAAHIEALTAENARLVEREKQLIVIEDAVSGKTQNLTVEVAEIQKQVDDTFNASTEKKDETNAE